MHRPAVVFAATALLGGAMAGPALAQSARGGPETDEPGVACDTRLAAQFPEVTRRLVWRGDPPTPQQLADGDIPTEAAVQDLRRLQPLANQCLAVTMQVLAGDPRATAAFEHVRRSRDQVFRLLIWRNGPWGEANRRMAVASQQLRRELEAARR